MIWPNIIAPDVINELILRTPVVKKFMRKIDNLLLLKGIGDPNGIYGRALETTTSNLNYWRRTILFRKLRSRNKDLHRELRQEIKRRKKIQKEKEKFEKAYAKRQKEIIRKAKQNAKRIIKEYKEQERFEYAETKRIINELKRENARLRRQDANFKREVKRLRKLQLSQQRQNKRDEKERLKQQERQKRVDRKNLIKMMTRERPWNSYANREYRKQQRLYQQQMEDENQVELLDQTEKFRLYRVKNLFARTIEAFLIVNRQKVLTVLETEGPNKKVVYTLKITMAKRVYDENDRHIETTDRQYISSNAFTILDQNDFETSYDSLVEFYNGILVDLELKGSGWYLKSIDHLDIKVSNYNPMRGGCFNDKLPKNLGFSKSVLQIQNTDDNQCLKWALSYQSLETKPTDHKYRVNKALTAQSKLLDFKGIEFPSCQKDLAKFEKQNSRYLVYCYGLNKDYSYFIYYKNKNFHDLSRQRQVLNILCFKNHFYQIINLKAFHKYIFKTEKCYFVCQSCLNHYATQDKLDEHYNYCQHEYPIRTSYPKPGSTLKFQKHQATLKHPFVAYFDTESSLEPINENNGNTKRYQKHNPSMFGLLLVNNVKNTSEYTLHKTFDELIEKLDEFARAIETSFVPLSGDELEKAKKAKKSKAKCDHCKLVFNHEDYPVLHHDHYTGKFVGVLHNSCNLKIRQRPFLPVFAHNLSRYDEKAIIRSIQGRSTIIAKNIENFISFDYLAPGTKNTKVKFLDSYKFLSSSLAKLTENLLDKGQDNFVYTKNDFADNFDLCLRKGVYPYDYVVDDEILNETKLPPIEAFYSQLSESHISQNDYLHAQNVWDTFNCRSLRDYTEVYLKLDVFLLADVFEQFRSFIFNEYSLDPVYYLTLSSLAMDCALRFSGVQLELLSDPTMYNFIESGIRGGVSMICKRFAVANNKYMKNYDPSKPSSFIVYNDANNLYGTPMLGDLPVKNFRWAKDTKWQNYGNCIVDVDIHLPKELHEKFKDFPLCPEHLDGKLMTTLYDKEHYVCHSKYLREVVSHGYVVKKVHKVLCFDSEPWLRDYVLKNTSLRAKAKSNFEKDLWKLMNNAVYGKQIENVRKRINVKMTNDDADYVKLVAKPNYKDTMLLQDSQYLVEMSKKSVTLNKPMYGGLAILDLSKIVMSNFYYNYFQPKFSQNLELLMTDTGSFMCLVHSEDYYEDIKDDVGKWFDTSGFDKDFKDGFPIGVNKKVPGKFKDEMSGKPITKFVGLRPKQYAYESEDTTTLKCKGINKQGMRSICFNDYVEALNPKTKTKYTNMNIIRSHKHQNYTETIRKKVLDPHDTKRIILPNGVDTLPLGYE